MKSSLVCVFAVLASCAAPEPLSPTPGRIAEDAPPRFLLVGDTQRTMALEVWRPSHDAQRLAVARAIADERPAFVLHAGDVVCHGFRHADWARFLKEYEPVFSRGIPCFPALGNHDYYGANREALAHRDAVFPHVAGRFWYEVRFPPVLVVVLDSNFDELTAERAREQDRWLESTLAAAEGDPAIRHVLVVCHHPPYTNAVGLGDSREVQERFVRRLTPKARVFASGHVHSYERFLKNGVQFLVSGGGGGPTREIDVAAPPPRGPLRRTPEPPLPLLPLHLERGEPGLRRPHALPGRHLEPRGRIFAQIMRTRRPRLASKAA